MNRTEQNRTEQNRTDNKTITSQEDIGFFSKDELEEILQVFVSIAQKKILTRADYSKYTKAMYYGVENRYITANNDLSLYGKDSWKTNIKNYLNDGVKEKWFCEGLHAMHFCNGNARTKNYAYKKASLHFSPDHKYSIEFLFKFSDIEKNIIQKLEARLFTVDNSHYNKYNGYASSIKDKIVFSVPVEVVQLDSGEISCVNVKISDENYEKYKDLITNIDTYFEYSANTDGIMENKVKQEINNDEITDLLFKSTEKVEKEIEYEEYTLNNFLSEVFIEKDKLDKLQSVLQNKKNLILKGAPGVGKTFIADRLAFLKMGKKDISRIHMIQFHQSYSYEDFIEGFRPKVGEDGFELKQGPFVDFAKKASNDPERDYFFIIDEINRGNMSKIFGELLMLIETDKRGKSINLLYSGNQFSVPNNLYIIGMMNTADRSLALLDYALRRRFSFFEIGPAFENATFKSYINQIKDSDKVINVISIIKELNKEINDNLGSGFQIGHSYFVDDALEENAEKRIEEIVEYEIIPQLEEYWFDDEEIARKWAEKLRGAY